MNPKSAKFETPAYVTKMGVRQDANRIALAAIRSMLDAAKPIRVNIGGVAIEISVKRMSASRLGRIVIWGRGGDKPKKA